MTEAVKYNIVKYADGQIHAEPGVKAGLWGILRTTTERIAYTDTEVQAHALIRLLLKGPHDD